MQNHLTIYAWICPESGEASFTPETTDEIIILHRRISELASVDDLTCILNRCFGLRRFREEFSNASYGNKSLGVILLDVDHFKAVNDTYGHDAGDMVLRQLANILSANIRAEDIICRYGGEEFLIVIPDADSESVCMMAERLRFKVENAGFTFADHTIPVTVSLGVSLRPDPGTDTVEKMVSAADKALYRAKETGRNRVVLLSGIRNG